MEMRAILCNLLREFRFELPDIQQDWNDPKLGLNHGTLGPKLPGIVNRAMPTLETPECAVVLSCFFFASVGQKKMGVTNFGLRYKYGLPLIVTRR